MLSIPIINRLATKYKFYINLNGILAKGFPFIQSKILEQDSFVTFFTLFFAVSGSLNILDTIGILNNPEVWGALTFLDVLAILDTGLRQNKCFQEVSDLIIKYKTLIKISKS